jgi:CHAT domain-containing protein
MSPSEASDRFLEILDRFFIAGLDVGAGRAAPESVGRLEDAIREGRELLAADLTPSRLETLRAKLAEAHELLGRAHLILGELGAARAAYQEAIAGYVELGNALAANGCRSRIEFIARTESGDRDSDVEELEAALMRTPAGSFEHCQLLAQTASLHQGVGDDQEACARLTAALNELASLDIRPPTAEEHREALADYLATEDPGADPDEAAARRKRSEAVDAALMLHSEIHTALAVLLRQKEPAVAARHAGEAEDLLARAVDQQTGSQLVAAALQRQRKPDEVWREALPQLLQPGGFAALIADDQAFPDGELKEQMLELDRRLAADQQSLWKRTMASRQKRDSAFAEHLARVYVDTGALRLKLALLGVRSALGGPEAAPGLLPRAEELEREAREGAHPGLLATALRRHGELLAALGRNVAATAVLTEGVDLLVRFEPHEQAVPLLAALAAIRARQGNWQAASDLCERGIRLVEKYRFNVTPPYLQLSYLRAGLPLYTLGARSAFELGLPGAALARADLSKCRGVLGWSRMAVEPEAEMQDTEREFREICRRTDKARATRNAPALLLAKRHALWDRLFIQRARRAHAAAGLAAAPAVLSLPAVQRRLAPDEAILYCYWLDAETLLVATIDRNRAEVAVRPLSPQLRSDLDLVSFARPRKLTGRRFGFADAAERAAIERDVQAAAAPAADWQDSLERLSALLLAGAAWLGEKRRLILSPHRGLHLVPFPALVYAGDRLLRRFAISHVPNLESLLLDHRPAPRPDRVLAVGTRTSRVLASPLPLAEREVTEVGDIYRRRGIDLTVLTGEEASKERLLALQAAQELRRFSCIHFAAHASDVAEDAPLESRLFLHDAELDGVEVSSWRLEADIVVLSACWSAKRLRAARGLPEVPGDEMLGLQGAFFAAGARRLVGALWPVRDAAARKIMVEFHRGLAAGAIPEIALQQSLLAYHEKRDSPPDLIDWAPFTLYCIGRPPAAA